jgi:3-hydroxyisobutyrate dehydrogenase-like beta-hydroxyacid dehydrogenase
MRVAFIGLGAMGLPIARHLIAAGHELRVWNRTAERAQALASEGAMVASSIADAVGAAEIVCTMLADDRAVTDVTWGGETTRGILQELPRGGAHVSLSTISIDLAARLASAHVDAGQQFVSAPVFGRPDVAAAGTLTVVAAGSPAAIEHCRPVLEPIGEALRIVGDDPPMANVVKLGGNFLIAAMIESLGEAFALMRKSGVPVEQFLDIVNGRVFRSPVYANYGRIIAAGRFEPPGFALRLGLKDVSLVLAAAQQAAAPMPVASLIRDQLLSAVALGRGDLDWSSFAALATERAGAKA